MCEWSGQAPSLNDRREGIRPDTPCACPSVGPQLPSSPYLWRPLQFLGLFRLLSVFICDQNSKDWVFYLLRLNPLFSLLNSRIIYRNLGTRLGNQFIGTPAEFFSGQIFQVRIVSICLEALLR
jgi:hypothetical protein